MTSDTSLDLSPAQTVRLLRQLNHDLRNPLNALTATASMLSEGMYDSLTEKQHHAVDLEYLTTSSGT